jgi:SPP1 gp7 family putative phage head morphogenesis protein
MPARKIETPEERIARVVSLAVGDALTEMQAVVARYLASGRKIDAVMMNQMAVELQRLAAEYGQGIVIKGELGKLMTAQRTAGAQDGGAGPAWLLLNKDALDVALNNDRVKIAGLLNNAADTINEIITAARVSGKPRLEVVREIMNRVQTEKEITRARAETIYRAETFSGYRQFSRASADAVGIGYFMQQGIADVRTSMICLDHHGEIKTAKEWEALEPHVFEYGLHYNCRCNWAPIRDPEAARIKDRAERYKTKAFDEKQARKLDPNRVKEYRKWHKKTGDKITRRKAA